MKRIENPYCKVHGMGLCAGFTIAGDRYHVWLNPEGTALKDKPILYKNPINIKKHQPGYYECKHLDATAKVNAALIAELLASIDPERAWADYRAEQAAEEAKLKAEAKARKDRETLEQAAPDLFLACEKAIGGIAWAEKPVR